MFTLVSVKNGEEGGVELEFDTTPWLPREVDPERYKRTRLFIYGLREEETFIAKLENYTGDFIDIEQLESKNLDFWSDAEQIGVYSFDRYSEIIEDYGINQWQEQYKSLCDQYHKLNDAYNQESLVWSRFVENVRFLLNKEVTNTKIKDQFLGPGSRSRDLNDKTNKLASKVLNLIEQYENEIRSLD